MTKREVTRNAPVTARRRCSGTLCALVARRSAGCQRRGAAARGWPATRGRRSGRTEARSPEDRALLVARGPDDEGVPEMPEAGTNHCSSLMIHTKMVSVPALRCPKLGAGARSLLAAAGCPRKVARVASESRCRGCARPQRAPAGRPAKASWLASSTMKVLGSEPGPKLRTAGQAPSQLVALLVASERGDEDVRECTGVPKAEGRGPGPRGEDVREHPEVPELQAEALFPIADKPDVRKP
eukprot:15445576-Alexandrium_andersonii.AAC.3